MLPDNEDQEETNKEDGDQTAKPGDKKPVQKHGNQVSYGSQDGPVSYDKDVLAAGQKTKYPKDQISIHCIQRAGRVLLMSSFGMLRDGQRMSNIFFHTNVTLVDVSILQAGEWPSAPWYPNTPTWDLSWFIKIHHALFPRFHDIKDFPYPNRLHLAHHIRFQKTSDILPRWGAYVKYPLPTEQGTGAMATSIREKIGGPHVDNSLSPWSQTDPPSLSHLCPFCNKSHNSRDSLMNHI